MEKITDNTMSAEVKSYEVGYLLTPLLPEEQVGEAVDRLIKAPVVAGGGTVSGDLAPKMTRLAYSIRKMIENKYQRFTDAYFGAVRFTAAPETVVALSRQLQKSPEVVRFLLVTLPRESENRKAKRRPARAAAAAPAEPAAAAPEADAQVIDREIEGLLSQTS